LEAIIHAGNQTHSSDDEIRLNATQ